MTGMVISAVRDTITNSMLSRKLSASAQSSSACQIFRSRSNVTTGKASATRHSENSWLWSM
jgi:hypothetical protein